MNKTKLREVAEGAIRFANECDVAQSPLAAKEHIKGLAQIVINLCSAPAQSEQDRRDANLRIDLTEEQAALLRDYIGEGDREITLAVLDAHAGFGLYAFDTDYLDEGCEFICAMQAQRKERT